MVGFLLLTGACSRHAPTATTQRAPPAVPVTVAPAALTNVPVQWPAIGHVVPFALVKSQDTVLTTVNQTEPIYVDFYLPERELPALREQLTGGRTLPVLSPSQ